MSARIAGEAERGRGADVAGATRVLDVLRVRRYRHLWLAQLISQLGDAFTGTALVYFVATVTGNAFSVGLVIFAMLLPAVVVGPFAGVLADLMSPRRLMVASDLGRFLIVAAMVPAALARNVPLLLALVMVEGVGTSFFNPARAALIPRIVQRDQIAAAVSFGQATAAAVGVAGPALGGLLIAVTHVAAAFAVDAFTFLVSALLVVTAAPAGSPAVRSGEAKCSGFGALRNGIRALGEKTGLRTLLTVLAAFSVLFGVLNTTLSTVLLQDFRLPAEAFGTAGAVRGAGGVIAAFMAPILMTLTTGTQLFLGGTVLMGLLMAGVLVVAPLTVLPGAWPVYPWVFLLGVATALVSITAQTLFVTLTPQNILGRVSALLQSTVNAANLAGILVGGALAGWLNSQEVTAATGIVMLALAGACAVLPGYHSLRREERALRPAVSSPHARGIDTEEAAESAHEVEAAWAKRLGMAAACPGGGPVGSAIVIRDVAMFNELTKPATAEILALLEQGPVDAPGIARALRLPTWLVERSLEALLPTGLVEAVAVPSVPAEGGRSEAQESTGRVFRLRSTHVDITPAALGGANGVDTLIGRVIEPGLHQLRDLAESIPRDLEGSALEEWLRNAGYEIQLTSQVLRLTPAKWHEIAGRLAQVLKDLAKTAVESSGGGSPIGEQKTYVFTLLSFRLPDSSIPEEVGACSGCSGQAWRDCSQAVGGAPEHDRASGQDSRYSFHQECRP